MIISISSGTILLFFFLLLVGWFLYEIKSLLLIIISAVIFSLALAPGKRFLARMRMPEPIAVVTLYIVVFLILLFFLYSFVPIFIQQYQVFIEALPSAIRTIQNFFIGTVFEDLAFNSDLAALLTNSEYVTQSLQTIVKTTGVSVAAAFGGLINIILFLLLTFLFSVNPKTLDTFLFVITPKRYRKYSEDLWARTKVKMGQWFQGQMVLVFLIGVLTYFALLLIGVPNALFLAVFAGAMELVPIFGPVLGAIPAVLMALTTGNLTVVALTIVVFVIIQQLENTLIYPLVVSKVVGISSVLIVLAIVIGGSIAGFIGVLIAVPLAGVIQEFFSDIKSGNLQKLQEADP